MSSRSHGERSQESIEERREREQDTEQKKIVVSFVNYSILYGFSFFQFLSGFWVFYILCGFSSFPIFFWVLGFASFFWVFPYFLCFVWIFSVATSDSNWVWRYKLTLPTSQASRAKF